MKNLKEGVAPKQVIVITGGVNMGKSLLRQMLERQAIEDRLKQEKKEENNESK